MSGGLNAWQRLAELLVQRRVALDPRYRNRRLFVEETGQEYRTIFDIEKARRTNFTRETLASIEIAYGWARGSIARTLDGGDPETVHQARDSDSATATEETTVERGEPRFQTLEGEGQNPAAYTEAKFLADLEAGIEPELPPGGLRDQSERLFWVLEEDAMWRWGAIKGRREAKAAFKARQATERKAAQQTETEQPPQNPRRRA